MLTNCLPSSSDRLDNWRYAIISHSAWKGKSRHTAYEYTDVIYDAFELSVPGYIIEGFHGEVYTILGFYR